MEKKTNKKVEKKNNEKKSNGLAIAALILGIAAISFAFVPVANMISYVTGALAAIFGIIALAQKQSTGQAVTGLVLGIIALIAAIVMNVALIGFFSEIVNEAIKDAENGNIKISSEIKGEMSDDILTDDVAIEMGNFIVTEGDYGMIETKLPVTIKNVDNEPNSYSIQIEAVNEDYIYASNLSPGQTQSFDLFKYVSSDKLEAMKTATFKVIKSTSY